MRRLAVLLAIVFAASATLAEEYRLAPWKDELFAYKKIIEKSFGGDYVRVEYVEARDMMERDIVDLKEVDPKYVDLSVRKLQRDLRLRQGFLASIRYMGLGKTDGGAKLTVIFFHGGSGNRRLAMEDLRFGGNFNRLKNLLARNEGAYLTPDLVDFKKRGEGDMRLLIADVAKKSPGAPIVVACASTGCNVAFALLSDPAAAPNIAGVVLIGMLGANKTFFESPGFAARVPIYMAHGSIDPTVEWTIPDAFFRQVKAVAPRYPIRFALFDTANHGIPIRMIDWRLALNWILSVRGK